MTLATAIHKKASGERFTSTGPLSQTRLYDRPFFTRLMRLLATAGLDGATVLLPSTHLPQDAAAFFGSDAAPDALLFIARGGGDVAKLLIVEDGKDVTFQDDTFVDEVAAGTKRVHVESSDPTRAFALRGYLQEQCHGQPPLRYAVMALLTAAATIFMFLEVLVVGFSQKFLIASEYHGAVAWDIVLSIVAVILLYRSYTHPDGLALKPRHSVRRLWRALAAPHVRAHPGLMFVLGVLTTVISGIVLRLLTPPRL